ncbi:MAG: hypothetical protein E6J60_13605 [Deltaproteobacteria bacterium]|nr:MAG: hypothetical protein E6J60_13605 [Deltaproteobacteria bacterium]
MQRSMVAALVLLALAAPARAERQADRVIVHGDGFPRFGAHVLFYQTKHALRGGATLIMVRLSTSAANDAAQDLQSDMDDYRRRFGGVAFRDLAVSHPEYACVAKEFAVESLFHEYLTYVSPGRGRAERFAAALNTEAAASVAELEAYRAIVGSLVLLEVSGPPR